MGTHPIFESDFDCLTENHKKRSLKLTTMVRSRKKSSTDNDTGDVVATPSRRSGRARKTVSYGEEDEIPVALLEGNVDDLSEEEVKPKRGRRKKSNASSTTSTNSSTPAKRERRALKAQLAEEPIKEGEEGEEEEMNSQTSQETIEETEKEENGHSEQVDGSTDRKPSDGESNQNNCKLEKEKKGQSVEEEKKGGNDVGG